MVGKCSHVYKIDYSSTVRRFVCIRCGYITGELSWSGSSTNIRFLTRTS